MQACPNDRRDLEVSGCSQENAGAVAVAQHNPTTALHDLTKSTWKQGTTAHVYPTTQPALLMKRAHSHYPHSQPFRPVQATSSQNA